MGIGTLYTNLPLSAILGGDPGAYLLYSYGRPANWSEERFKKAEEKFNSFMSDFDWTIDQHQIGAEFAAKVCVPEPSRFPKNSCSG